jgi:hypothetical protein
MTIYNQWNNHKHDYDTKYESTLVFSKNTKMGNRLCMDINSRWINCCRICYKIKGHKMAYMARDSDGNRIIVHTESGKIIEDIW